MEPASGAESAVLSHLATATSLMPEVYLTIYMGKGADLAEQRMLTGKKWTSKTLNDIDKTAKTLTILKAISTRPRHQNPAIS